MAVKEKVNGVLNKIETTENRIKHRISENKNNIKNSITEKIKQFLNKSIKDMKEKAGFTPKDIKTKINEKRILKYLIYIAIGISFLLLFKKLVIVGILLLITTIFGFFAGLTPLKVFGVETAALTAVISGILIGPTWGFIFGAIAVFIHLFAVRNLNFYMLWVLPGYGVIGIASGIMADTPIQTLGITLVIIMNLIFFGLTLITSPSHIIHFLAHSIGNIIFNYILFTTIAPLILNIAIG